MRDVATNLRLWGGGSAAELGRWMILRSGLEIPGVTGYVKVGGRSKRSWGAGWWRADLKSPIPKEVGRVN